MDKRIRELLAELEVSGQANDAREHERRKLMLNLHPQTAHLLGMLVRIGRRTQILEIGTSNGYSTIWLAWATQQFGGRVTSIDRDADKHRLADSNLRRAGLREVVDLRQGEALAILPTLAGPFDLVFFDADRLTAADQLGILLPRLTHDALVLADNALSHPDEIRHYLEAVQARPEFEHLIVPVGKGLSIAYKNRR